MPPHLHPRSRLTSSLFATTLFASFFVVALPHILPCPAPRIVYADGEMPPRRRRKRKCVDEKGDGALKDSAVAEESAEEGDEIEGRMGKPKRECPVPKPTGIVGEILGFKGSSSSSSTDGKGSRPP